MSATPRTDSMAKPSKQYVCECVPARFARQLELENGELRKALQAVVDKSRQMPVVRLAMDALARSGKGEA